MEAKMKTINALAFRKKFGSILDEVHFKKTHIIISRSNKPLAVIIPFDDYKEQEEKKAREKRLRLAAYKIDQWRKKHTQELRGLSSIDVIRQIRRER